MNFSAIANRLNKKLYRHKHRRVLQQWKDDGGDERFRYDYDLNSNDFVMDLGGYEGEWTGNIREKFGSQVAIFEPVKKFAEKIKDKFSQDDGVEICQYGLGKSSRIETIYLWGAGTSAFRKRAKTEEIRIVDITQWFSDRNMKSVQLMKINIEGGEFELLERLLETELISRIENIQVQFHNIAVESTRRMERIQQGMEKTHKPTYQYKFVWENWVLK
jgi:FkbM family methyltransferase